MAMTSPATMGFNRMQGPLYFLTSYETLHSANEMDLDYTNLRYSIAHTFSFGAKPVKLEPKGTFWKWDCDALLLLEKYKENTALLKFAGVALIYYLNQAGYNYGVIYATETGLYWYAEPNDEMSGHIYCEHRVTPKPHSLCS